MFYPEIIWHGIYFLKHLSTFLASFSRIHRLSLGSSWVGGASDSTVHGPEASFQVEGIFFFLLLLNPTSGDSYFSPTDFFFFLKNG